MKYPDYESLADAACNLPEAEDELLELYRLCKIYIEAYGDAYYLGFIGVGAITYAEQQLRKAQEEHYAI